MESIFANLYLDLQERIKQQVPEIECIEQDFRQEVFDKWRSNVAFPAILIDFPETKYSALSQANELGETTINLRLLLNPFNESYEGAPLEVRQDALQFFELEQKLVLALHNWQPSNQYCQPLIRNRATGNNHNELNLRIRELVFTTTHEEYFNE